MSTINGRDGSLEFNSLVVAETRNYTITETQESYAANILGSGDWDRSVGGRKMWTADVNCFYDPTATTGNSSTIDIGDEAACSFYPEGDTTGNQQRTGTARVEEMTSTIGEDGLVELSIKLKGVGELGKSDVPA